MARRRGNKKRRDTERDSTAVRRIAKVGAVTAGVIAGGAAFRHSDMGKRLASSGLAEAAIKSTRGFKRDMLNKPVNIKTLKHAYDRNIGAGGKVIKEEAEKIKGTTERNLSNIDFIKKLHRSKHSKEIILSEGRKEEHLKRKDKFAEQMIKNAKLTGKKAEKMKDIIDSAYMHTTEDNVKDGTMMSYMNKKVKKSGFAEDDIKNLLNNIVKYKEDNQIDNDDIKQLYGSLADKISMEKREALKHNTGSGLLNKIDKKFGTKLEETILGNRAATLGDMERLGLLEDTDFGQRIIKQFLPDEGEYKNTKIIDYNKEIKNLLAQGVFNDAVLDRGLRIAKDENGVERLIDNREAFGLLDNIKQAISDTLPGKLLLKNMDLGDKKTLGVLHSGTRDLNAHLTGATNNIMQNMMVYMDGNLYGTTINANGEVDLDNTVTKVKQATGWRKKIVRDILGTNQQPIEAYDGKWMQRLDINQDGNFNIKEEFKRMLDSKTEANPEWEKNELRRSKLLMTEGSSAALKSTIMELAAENPSMTNDELLAAAKARLHKSNLTTSIIMNKQITGVSDGLIELVKENGGLSERDLNLLNLLQDGSDDAISEFLYSIAQNKNGEIDSDSIANDKLRGIVEMTYKNFEKAEDISHISIKEGKYNPLFSMPIDEQWKRDQAGQLRVEMLKDIMIRQSEGANPDPDSVMRWIYGLGASTDQISTLENIGALGIFENYMKIDGKAFDANVGARFNVGGSEDKLSVMLADDGILKNTFSNRMDELIAGFSPRTKNYLGGVNQTNFYDEYNEITLVKESGLHPLNIIKNINNFIKDGDGSSLIDTLKELNAGRNNAANVSELTLQIQNSITRINYSLAEVGLNLSSQSMGSPLQSYLNFGLKRVLPVMVGAKTFEYLNDTSRTLLGSSITEAAARGASYIDIGARNALYKVGIGQQINSWAESSVIHEYMFGSNKFDTADERAEWYQNGYSPVRKGRYWGFGSSSEFRGSSISYWQPNYLRRTESNYHDISVYGSSEEKWAHSWIPTPTHPFSTIRAVANPYWLEKKHLKENDRPYPITAKMFSEGTPWGAVLNPTVGELLKPVRMLPEARRRLGKSGRDINAVLENINNRIKAKDRDNNLLLVNGSDIRNGEYVPFGNPESGEINLSIRNGRVTIPGYGYMNGLESISDYAAPNGQDYVAGYGNGTNRAVTANNYYDEGLLNKLEGSERGVLNQLSKGFSNGEVENFAAMGIVSNINSFIKNRGAKYGAGYRNISSINSGPIKSEGTYIYKTLVNDYNNYLDNFYAKDDIKMINTSRQSDYVRDIVYSNKQISGMYGYLAGMALDSGNTHTFRYENAGQMSSFSRGFWDSSIGGLGGGTMEIARRFFPSEDRRRINVNPLRNNMPDWIPESYKVGKYKDCRL